MLLVLTYVFNSLTPFMRFFRLGDPYIAYPYTIHERVPTWQLVLDSVGVPLVLIVAMSAFYHRSRLRTHHTVLGFALCISMSLIVYVELADRPRS